jgi:hypothetical protein
MKPTSDKILSVAVGDPGAFESNVALAQSYLSRSLGHGEEPSKEALYHQTRAILFLQKHLEAGSVSTGALLASVNVLIMSIVQGDRRTYDFHRKRLGRMILNPPPDSTTGLIHSIVQGFFVTSRFYFRLLKLQTQPAQQTLLNQPNSQIGNKLTYPRHSFYPTLSADIITLPSGFHDLIIELSLPIQLIEVLKLIAHWSKHP